MIRKTKVSIVGLRLYLETMSDRTYINFPLLKGFLTRNQAIQELYRLEKKGRKWIE